MALAWGNARSQFQLVRSRVEEELGKGVPKSQIFRALSDEGKINLAQRTFYKYVAKAQKSKDEQAQSSVIVPPPKNAGSGPTTPQAPILPGKPKPKGRFQMADKIPVYD